MTQSTVDARRALASAQPDIAQRSGETDLAHTVEAVDQVEALAVDARIRCAFVDKNLAVSASEAGRARAVVRAGRRLIRNALSVVQARVVVDGAQVYLGLAQCSAVARWTVASRNTWRLLVAYAAVRTVSGSARGRVLGAVRTAVGEGALTHERVRARHHAHAVVQARVRCAQIDERVAEHARVSPGARAREGAGRVDHAQAVRARVRGAHVEQSTATRVRPSERTRAHVSEAGLDTGTAVETGVHGAEVDGRGAERVGETGRTDAREPGGAGRHAPTAVVARVRLTRVDVRLAVLARELRLTDTGVVAHASLRRKAQSAVLARHARAKVDRRLAQVVRPAARAVAPEPVHDRRAVAVVQARVALAVVDLHLASGAREAGQA